MNQIVLINGQTWLICGGRDFVDEEMFNSAMGDLVRLRGMPQSIVQGGAAGADDLARQWAIRHAIHIHTELPDWDNHGRAAGPIRNQVMLQRYNPTMVVAFPGGRGTADMVRRSRVAKIDLAEICQKKGPGSVDTEPEACTRG